MPICHKNVLVLWCLKHFLRVQEHAHARIFAWLLGTCISETTADIAGNQTPMPEDQRELYTMQTTSATALMLIKLTHTSVAKVQFLYIHVT